MDIAEEDTALVARLRGGEESAFEEAVASFYPAMLANLRELAR